MSTLHELGTDQRDKYLQEMGISMGKRHKIAKALAENAKATKKEAALKDAEDSMEKAAVQLQHDKERIEKQKKQIEKLRGVIAARTKPPRIICPISQDIMVNPVVAADGHTYGRAQIEEWLQKKKTSPMTGADLGDTTLRENIIVRGMVQDFIEECEAAGTDPNEAA